MKKMITVAKIIISVIVFWFLVHTSKLDFSLLLDLFTSPITLTYTFLIYFLVIGISSWRWHQLNQAQNISLSFIKTIPPTYLGVAFNNLLPGGVGGDFYRGYFLFKHHPSNRSAAMLSILFDRLTGLLGVFIAAFFAILFHSALFQDSSIIPYILICLGVTFSGVISLFYLPTLFKKLHFLSHFKEKYKDKKWCGSLDSILQAITIYKNSKTVILKCLIASTLIQFMIVITCVLIAQMMHFPTIKITDYIIAASVTQIVNLIPIAPGGFGIGEAAFANILTFLNPGINATYATIFLAYRILGIISYLPGIFIFIFNGTRFKTLKIENS